MDVGIYAGGRPVEHFDLPGTALPLLHIPTHLPHLERTIAGLGLHFLAVNKESHPATVELPPATNQEMNRVAGNRKSRGEGAACATACIAPRAPHYARTIENRPLATR